MDTPLTPEQIAAIKAARRRKKEKRERAKATWLRWQEDIRRQIEEARRRRKRFLFWLLIGFIMTQISANWFMPRPVIYRPEPPRRPKQQGKRPVKKSKEWAPSPEDDFAPKRGSDDYIDGYSREFWERMADEKGWRPGSKLAMKRAWENDPHRAEFPQRYREWDHRPSLFELARDFCDPHQQAVAFEALLIAAPADAKTWLQEAYVSDPGQIRRAFADRSDKIADEFKKSAVRWEEMKQREAEEARNAARKLKRDKGHNTDTEENEDEHGIP